MQSKLVKNFKNFIFREELFSGGEKLVVGISGGADSVCLLKLLLAVKEKFDLELQLVHINYGLRGKNSDGDESFVRELAEKEGLELEVVKFAQRVDGSTNLEEKLRDFRYEAFEEIRVEKNFDLIVVAHHRDDQVETFLMNLLRGAGVEGLKGMIIQDEQRKILRPLLNFSRKEIVNFLKDLKQGWREDESNQDNTFLRNRIRNELVPEIEENYSVKFKERVSGVTRQLQQHLVIIDKEVNKKVGLVVRKVGSGAEIDVDKYEKLTEEIKPLVFRSIIERLKGNLKNISENNYLEFEKIMRSGKGKNQKMQMNNLKFERINKKLIISGIIKK